MRMCVVLNSRLVVYKFNIFNLTINLNSNLTVFILGFDIE